MSDRCVFLDRDNTIMEDPGYLTEPEAVKVLPGADLALRSLARAGYRLVVVTNQSAIARGLLTEEGLERVHDELRRQLEQRQVSLDGIYYCPHHPEGTVEAYARESEDRKPNPGMLLRAAGELDIDLVNSWMIGDSPRDIEAGQRAGCRTVRVRVKAEEDQDEDSQADYTVRNLVDAARVILNESGEGAVSAAGETAAPVTPVPPSAAQTPLEKMSERQLLREILRHVREAGARRQEAEFSTSRLVAAVFQILAVVALVWAAIHIPGATSDPTSLESYNALVVVHIFVLAAAVLQVAALTFFLISRHR